MIKESNLPINTSCSLLKVSRDTYYNWNNHPPKEDRDTELRKTMHSIAGEFPKYGYRRVTAELHRRSILVNNKKVRRIMKEESLTLKKKRITKRTTNSMHQFPTYPNLTKTLVVGRLNQLWAADITYIVLGMDFVYLASIMDVFSRKCVGWALSRNINSELALNALRMAISNRAPIGFENLIHHSDRGVQYACNEYVNLLKSIGAHISMTESGDPRENAFAESFFKTLKYEEVHLKEYESFEDTYNNIKEFIEKVYNAKRLHSSIGYMPPVEFEQKLLNTIKLR